MTCKNGESPARRAFWLAELSQYESSDRTTEAARLKLVFGLHEHPHDGLRARRADEHAARSVEPTVDLLELRAQLLREFLGLHLHVLLRLRPPGHHGGRLGERAALERAAEEERSGETVTGDVVAEVDDVARLLAAQDGPFLAQGLEDVPVSH